MVDVELLPPGEGVERLVALDVDRERRVAAPAGLGARPLGRGDHRHRGDLGVGEGDLLALVLGGEVGQLRAGALLQELEALGREVAVGHPGQVQDRVGHLHVGLERGLAVAGAAVGDAVAARGCPPRASTSYATPLVGMPTFSISGPSDVIFS